MLWKDAIRASTERDWTLNQATPHEAARPLPSTAGAMAPMDGDSRTNAIKATVLKCFEEMKAVDTIEIGLAGKTSIADYMLITSGGSQRHVGSIADRVVEVLKSEGFGPIRVEGVPACDWVLIDAGDVLAHVFRPEVRSFYNLEKMWGADRPQERSPQVGAV